jgi:hypothetical protein
MDFARWAVRGAAPGAALFPTSAGHIDLSRRTATLAYLIPEVDAQALRSFGSGIDWLRLASPPPHVQWKGVAI